MDLMVMDVICRDSEPSGLDSSAPYFGSEADDYIACIESRDENSSNACVVVIGRCMDGTSTCALVSGYKPWTRVLCNRPCTILDVKAYVSHVLKEDLNHIIVEEELLPKFYGFVPSDAAEPAPKKYVCYKIRLQSFKLVQRLEWRLSRKGPISPAKNGSPAHLTKTIIPLENILELTDASTPADVKFMNDLQLVHSSWVRIDNAVYCGFRVSTCTTHVTCNVSNLRPLDTAVVGPLKILSFDAEMYSTDNSFPEVIHGAKTIAICASLYIAGQPGIQRRTAFVVWPKTRALCPITSGLNVIYCDDSVDLMEQFRDYIVQEDPDLLTGWNIYGFDMPFLWDEYAASFMNPKDRGPESQRKSVLQVLQRPFDTLADLLQLARGNDAAKKAYRDAISSVHQRWRKHVTKPNQLPEHVARPLRTSIRDAMGMPKESTFGGADDLAILKAAALPYFDVTMGQPKYTSFKRGQFLSRMMEPSSLGEKRMASAAKGDNTYYFWTGRACVDLMHIIKDDKKLDDNSLKFAAQTFLDPDYGKIDMSPAEIFAAWRTQDAAAMTRMIDYCARDADIPILLIDKLAYVPQWIEMSRVTYTSLQQVLNGGQQRKVYNLIARFVHGTHAINKCDSGWPISDAVSDSSGSELEHHEDALKKRRPDYQGATVIEPVPGFYQEPVSTLDFESLYPSIIIHFNLCPSVYLTQPLESYNTSGAGAGTDSRSTLVLESHTIHHSILTDSSHDAYAEFDKTYVFVKNVQGVVPKLLQHLLRARKEAKKAMAAAPDDFSKSVQNGRQLALKMSCNSVYGFFGVNPAKGLLSCKPVAAVTTLRGRAFIEAAKEYVETHYNGARVLYGDTDSIMINWGAHVDVPRAYQLAEEASSSITDLLRLGAVAGASRPVLQSAASAVTLANEKVYWPFLLIQKKNYAAMKYLLRGGHKPQSLNDFECSMDMKGIDAVRRDRSKLVKTLSAEVLDALLVHKSLDRAIGTVTHVLNEVANQQAPLDWFVLSKSLKGHYASENQPHVQAWKRMIARGDTDVPEIGTRMPFVIVAAKGFYKTAKALYERTEHPDYVVKAKLFYCARYYLENAQDVIERLLGPTGLGPTVKGLFEQAIERAEHKASGNMSLRAFKKAKV